MVVTSLRVDAVAGGQATGDVVVGVVALEERVQKRRSELSCQ
jgi:hypothetical protein